MCRVQWSHHSEAEATWEREDELRKTYLRAILSWVSGSEPQLGMMINQFKRGDGFGVGYTYTKSDFDMSNLTQAS